MVNTPYMLDADMLGPDFRGTTGDLSRFREILATQCGRSLETLVVRQHPGQDEGADEPSERDWNAALDTFAAEHPELWRGE